MLGNYNEANAKVIVDYLKKIGLNGYAIAGILANWYHESLLLSDNAQDSYMNSLHMTDAQYTELVDSDKWIHPAKGKAFAEDGIGYGLAQWTSAGRKAGLLEFSKQFKTSISDLNMQLNYFNKELNLSSYKNIKTKLYNASDEKQAAIDFMVYYERPASVNNESARNGRAATASEFYKRYFTNCTSSDAYLMSALVFIQKLYDIANNYKTLYVLGTWGWPATESNKNRAITKKAYNATTARAAKINAASRDTFFFDCAGLIKGILWGWCGDVNRVYGGAGYACNGVPDSSKLIALCKDVSTDFSTIVPGELLYLPGTTMAHVGVYVGDGKVIECTPIWKDGVQITYLGNIGYTKGNYRMWERHGKLPWLDYSMVMRELNNTRENITTSEDIFMAEPVIYIVMKGDNLTKIAKKFSTTVDELASTNNISNPNIIRIGQKLVVKGTANQADEDKLQTKAELTYVVKRGDTLTYIAKKYGTTVLLLAAKNGIVNPNKISVGQVLKI